MKIICIGRNYSEHIKELKNEVPTEPVIFIKPDSAILGNNKDFYIPEFSNEIHHEIEIVVKIKKQGKHIQAKFAHRYFDEITVGLDFTARDLQTSLREKGLPWEKSKCFDGSAVIGDFIDKNELKEELSSIDFRLENNGITVQEGNAKDMIHSIDHIIEHVSQYFTLKIGDLIFTGTPAGVGRVDIGNTLKGYFNNKLLLTTNIK